MKILSDTQLSYTDVSKTNFATWNNSKMSVRAPETLQAENRVLFGGSNSIGVIRKKQNPPDKDLTDFLLSRSSKLNAYCFNFGGAAICGGYKNCKKDKGSL